MIDRLVPSLLMARRNLTRTRVRSALAALGIVIGVIAIASLGMLGATLRTQATQNLGEIGNQLVVSPAGEGDGELTGREVREIERAADGGAVVPYDTTSERVSTGRQTGAASVYRMANPGDVYAARQGRVPNPLRNGALVGATLAEEFDLEPGNAIEVNGSVYRIKAVLEEGGGFSPANPDSSIVVPPRRSGGPYSQVVVEAETGEAANATAIAIRSRLNDREERVTVFELSSFTDQISEFFGFVNVFLLGIGSISLLVAGVSILNVMLMSTVERREEIGVLRAVGFQKRDVLKIMLSEAAMLGVVGGLVGAVASLGIGAVVAQVALGDATTVLRPSNLLYLLLAFGFGLGTSLLSGLYPAWKAANEHPVEALRS